MRERVGLDSFAITTLRWWSRGSGDGLVSGRGGGTSGKHVEGATRLIPGRSDSEVSVPSATTG